MLYYNRKYFFPALFFAPDIKSCCNLAPGSINSSDSPAVSFHSEDLCKAVRYVRKPPTSADSSQPLVYCRFCLRIMGLFLICQWTWRYVTAEPQSEAVNVNHVMKCMAVFWWQTLLTFLLSCMKDVVVWSPCFPSCDVTEALFNGSFFCVCLALKDKKTLFSHWHATVCSWLTQRRNSQRHVDLLSLSSKKRSSSTSFSLIWSGLQSSAQWKLITLGLLLIVNSFGLFLKEFTKELIHYSFMCRCRL